MRALIIAAGRGRRLRSKFAPKPLALIFGVPLIERIIYRAKRAGIKEFVVVIGYRGDEIKQKLGDGKKYGVRIQYVYNDEWEKENGISVLKAEKVLKNEKQFVLLMSDHLFDHTTLKELIKRGVKENHCVLCVDRNLNGWYFTLDDATKVWIEDGKIKKIGKHLRKYNGIDTGVFLCTPVIFDALKESIKRGSYTLSAANQILAERGLLDAMDVTGHFWVDVDDEVALEKAEKILVKNLSKPTDGPIARFINRPVSLKISTFLAKTKITPNQVTFLSFLIAVIASVCFFTGEYIKIIAGGILAQLSSIIDGCDGEIARLKLSISKFGEWFDRVLDRVADGLMILGLTRAAWLHTAQEWVWILGFFTMMGSFLNSYTAVWYDKIIEREGILRFGRDMRIFIIFLGALFNLIIPTLLILAVVTNLENIRRLIRLGYGYEIREER